MNQYKPHNFHYGLLQCQQRWEISDIISRETNGLPWIRLDAKMIQKSQNAEMLAKMFVNWHLTHW